MTFGRQTKLPIGRWMTLAAALWMVVGCMGVDPEQVEIELALTGVGVGDVESSGTIGSKSSADPRGAIIEAKAPPVVAAEPEPGVELDVAELESVGGEATLTFSWEGPKGEVPPRYVLRFRTADEPRWRVRAVGAEELRCQQSGWCRWDSSLEELALPIGVPIEWAVGIDGDEKSFCPPRELLLTGDRSRLACHLIHLPG